MIKLIPFVFILLLVISGESLGCSCSPIPITSKSIDEIRNEKREYFLNEFRGAVFTGKVVKVDRVVINWVRKTQEGEPVPIDYFRYTIRVKEHWLGVDSRTMIVYGEPDIGLGGSRSSCGFKLKKGKTYFFAPQFYNYPSLVMGQCDWGRWDPDSATEFTKIMGEPKHF